MIFAGRRGHAASAKACGSKVEAHLMSQHREMLRPGAPHFELPVSNFAQACFVYEAKSDSRHRHSDSVL